MKYTYEGVVVSVGKEQIFSSGFKKRTIVLTEGGDTKYPNFIEFTFKQDKAKLLSEDGIGKGAVVKVTFFINGRKWESPQGTRFFNDLVADSIEVLSSCPDVEEAPCENDMEEEPSDSDDIPF